MRDRAHGGAGSARKRAARSSSRATFDGPALRRASERSLDAPGAHSARERARTQALAGRTEPRSTGVRACRHCELPGARAYAVCS
eukprot:14329065-Alexandrium_andersonii.AAC.1